MSEGGGGGYTGLARGSDPLSQVIIFPLATDNHGTKQGLKHHGPSLPIRQVI